MALKGKEAYAWCCQSNILVTSIAILSSLRARGPSSDGGGHSMFVCIVCV